jgi:uncharacterized membrane protein YphA (DoxX/SURF4 family)
MLRVVIGVIFVGHGAQKLFGSFGGGGAGAADSLPRSAIAGPR